MNDKYPEFYNFKLKMVNDSRESKTLAQKIDKHLERWCEIADESDVIRFEKIVIDRETTVYEGCFKFYFIYYDEKGLLDFGNEINELCNGSYLSFYSVKTGNCKHYLYGDFKEKQTKIDPNDTTEYYLFKLFYEITLDKSIVENLYENKIPSGVSEKEKEMYEDLLEEELFEDPWSVLDFERHTNIRERLEYKGSDPVYIEPYGCIGFRKPLWDKKYNVSADVEDIIQQAQQIKACVSDMNKKALIPRMVTFEGMGYSKFGLLDQNNQPNGKCGEGVDANAIYMFATNAHSIIKIKLDGEEQLTVIKYK